MGFLSCVVDVVDVGLSHFFESLEVGAEDVEEELVALVVVGVLVAGTVMVELRSKIVGGVLVRDVEAE